MELRRSDGAAVTNTVEAETDVLARTAALHRPTLAAVCLGLSGVLFIVYPVLRPRGDGSGAASVAAFASPAWLGAHLCAVVGFIGVAIGLLGLRDALAGYLGGRLASIAMLLWWPGAGLVLTYYGAEAYALNALGGWVERTRDFDLLDLATAIRMNPVQLTIFGIGLVLLAAAAVLTAVSVLRSGAMPPGSGLVFALGFLTYLPQFFAPDWVRIVHGVITGLGCLVLAVQLRRLSQSG